jgi:hypothetical protein
VRIWVAVVAAALLVGAVPTAAILLASHDSSSAAQHAGHRPPWAGHGVAKGHDRGRSGPAPGWHGRGPGSWHQHGHRQWHRQWHREWLQLTPEQRAKRMATLARRHAKQLEKWADCVDRTDDPASCPRPVPPGLAKKGLSPRPRQG